MPKPTTLNRDILRLAIPNIISNISVPLLSSVDTALMGRQQDAALYIGAVGLGGMVFNFVYWSFSFLRMGTTGLAAQAYGRGEAEALAAVLARAMLFAGIGALGLWLLQVPLGELGIWIAGGGPEVRPLMATYFYIRIWAAPATLGLFALMGWFFGLQNALLPLLLTVVGNVVNIGASYALIAYAGMDVDGVAWGTVIAQYSTFALALALAWWRYRPYLRLMRAAHWRERRAIGQFLRLNRDILIRTFCLIFAFTFFYNRSAAYGVLLLAANQVFLQFLNWMSYGVDGFAYAAESLTGKYAGAGDRGQLRRAIGLAMWWGLGLALLFSAAYGFLGEAIFRLFTSDAEVLAVAADYYWWMVLFPVVGTACYVWDGVFVGLTASRAMRDTMLLALLVYVLAYLAFRGPLGNHGLWLALMLFLAARGLLQTWWYRRGWLD